MAKTAVRKGQLRNAERTKAESMLEHVRCAVIAALLSVYSIPSVAEDEIETIHADIAAQLNSLPVNGFISIDDVWTGEVLRNICLVSNDEEIDLEAGGCKANTSSLLFVDRNGRCVSVDLSSVRSRILSGSLETECEKMRPNLALTKIDRYGQHHIIFSDPLNN